VRVRPRDPRLANRGVIVARGCECCRTVLAGCRPPGRHRGHPSIHAAAHLHRAGCVRGPARIMVIDFSRRFTHREARACCSGWAIGRSLDVRHDGAVDFLRRSDVAVRRLPALGDASISRGPDSTVTPDANPLIGAAPGRGLFLITDSAVTDFSTLLAGGCSPTSSPAEIPLRPIAVRADRFSARQRLRANATSSAARSACDGPPADQGTPAPVRCPLEIGRSIRSACANARRATLVCSAELALAGVAFSRRFHTRARAALSRAGRRPS
jgi:hypothetical protein